MELSHTLLRIIRSVEDIAYLNSEEIKYEKPIVDVIVSGKSLKECQDELSKVKEEVAFWTSLKQRKQDIYTKNKNKVRSASDKAIYELEQEIVQNKDKNAYIDKIYVNREYEVWEKIDERIHAINGDYMIIPCYFEEVYSNVKY